MRICGLARFAADIETTSFGEDKVRISSRLAFKRKRAKQDGPSADFFNCVAFNGIAKTISEYLQKGSLIYVEGDMQNNNWVDKDGNTHYDNQIIIESFEFTPSKSDDSIKEKVDSSGFIEIPDGVDEELPF